METWQHRMAYVNGIRLHYVIQGSGPLLVLLHGWPQSWYQWRLIIPALAEHYTVIAPDLRGYGYSDKPAGGYDKRTMATDIHELVRFLGYNQIKLVGHDRGARVSHRYGLDYPDEVEKLVIMDIVPTRAVFERVNAEIARGYWHWFFHLVPDLPELLVGANVEAYLRYFFTTWAHNRAVFTPEVIAEYVHTYSAPGALRGGFNDYRAGIAEDWSQDKQDAGKKLKMPTLVLWGGGSIVHLFNVLEIWQEFAHDVRGEAIPECGHFLPEEKPEIVLQKLLEFL
jgi:pimeloyl-ACP methyl ester carboxylesterase